MRQPKKAADSRFDSYESITTDVDGLEYTGDLFLKDVGAGKVMFALTFRGERHEDKSLYRRDNPAMRAFAESDLKGLVRSWLAKQKTNG